MVGSPSLIGGNWAARIGQEGVVERDPDDDREDREVEYRPLELSGVPPGGVGQHGRDQAEHGDLLLDRPVDG